MYYYSTLVDCCRYIAYSDTEFCFVYQLLTLRCLEVKNTFYFPVFLHSKRVISKLCAPFYTSTLVHVLKLKKTPFQNSQQFCVV